MNLGLLGLVSFFLLGSIISYPFEWSGKGFATKCLFSMSWIYGLDEIY